MSRVFSGPVGGFGEAFVKELKVVFDDAFHSHIVDDVAAGRRHGTPAATGGGRQDRQLLRRHRRRGGREIGGRSEWSWLKPS